jgi:hypothetical protein
MWEELNATFGVKVLDYQNEWASLPENVFNSNGTKRGCGGLL